jgi:Sel1 repeat
MPDTILSPGDPAVLRDTSRRVSEQGAGAKRRTSPVEAAPPLAGLVRAQRSPYGALARAERVGPRWRDIEWIDFTSDPDSANISEPAADIAGPGPAPQARDALRNVTRRFAGSAPPPDAKAAGVPGLPRRFARIPVHLAPPPLVPPSPSGIAQLIAALPPGSVVVRPRTPPPAAIVEPVAAPRPAAPPEPSPEPVRHSEPPPAPAPAAVAPSAPAPPTAVVDDDRSFPASIFTSTSTAAAPPDPAPSVGATLAARLNRVGAEMRGKSGIAAAALAGGVGRAREALQARLPRPAAERSRPSPPEPPPVEPSPSEPPLLPVAVEQPVAGERPEPTDAAIADAALADAALADEPPRRAMPPLAARLAGAANAVARRIAAVEPRLRLSGLVVLTALLVAVAAYVGGAFIAGLAGTGGNGGGAKPRTAMSDQPIRAVPSATPVVAAAPAPPPPPPRPAPTAPPSDPAARAAFYLAKAKAGDAAAQFDVGVLYARGDGLVQDYASALSWFHAAAARGNVAAEYNLGVLYQHGLGVDASETQALNWYRSAADQNDGAAQFNLALAYAEGRGTKQDTAAASRWYLRAAKHGLAPAMMNLAILYERGDGVDRSPVDAYAWYSAAGERGDAAAKTRAGELFREFDDREKARAEGLAATIGAALDRSAPPA